MDLPSPAQAFSPEIQFLYGLQSGRTRLGLASTRHLLRLVGSPERDVPVVHVAGTNGKGSTAAYAAAMLESAGLRVGRFTSPHILSVEERICIDGVPIDPAEFAGRVRELRPAIERAGASFFESMTAIAARVFQAARVDAAVYEVGLGGRLDATNALPATVSVVTSIGHDHETILGRGLRAVCGEKLGIARAGVPLHAALTRPDLVRLARDHCARKRTPFKLLDPGLASVRSIDLGGMRFDLALPGGAGLWTSFHGAHYARNAALAALAVADLLAARGKDEHTNLAAATARAFLPGRLQVLPASGTSPRVILDVAHNPEALQTTLQVVRALLGDERPVVVLGMMRDKRLGDASKLLDGWARELWIVAPRVARAWEPRRVAARLRARGGDLVLEVEPDACQALSRAMTRATTVLVLGSHYLVGEVLPHLAAMRGVSAQSLLSAPAVQPRMPAPAR